MNLTQAIDAAKLSRTNLEVTPGPKGTQRLQTKSDNRAKQRTREILAAAQVHGPTCPCKDCMTMYAGGPGSGRKPTGRAKQKVSRSPRELADQSETKSVAREFSYHPYEMSRKGERVHSTQGHKLVIDPDGSWMHTTKQGERSFGDDAESLHQHLRKFHDEDNGPHGGGLRGSVSAEHIGFKKLEDKFAKEGKSNPAGLAYSIGKKKYGKEGMEKKSKKGKKKAMKAAPPGLLDRTVNNNPNMPPAPSYQMKSGGPGSGRRPGSGSSKLEKISKIAKRVQDSELSKSKTSDKKLRKAFAVEVQKSGRKVYKQGHYPYGGGHYVSVEHPSTGELTEWQIKDGVIHR